MPKFVEPNFSRKDLELRFENNEICIYGTKEGLKKISELIINLIEHPKKGHIHLEDYELLTDDSLIGAVAIFERKK